MTTTTNTVNVKSLLVKLLDVTEPNITYQAIADIVAEVKEAELHQAALAQAESEKDWLGLPVTRKYTIKAPAHAYQEYDATGKRVVVRDYFREITNATYGDEYLVEVQQGLQPATIQKNVDSLLKSVKNKSFGTFKTTCTSDGILVSFNLKAK